MNPRATISSIGAGIAVAAVALGVLVRDLGPAADEAILSQRRGFGVALTPRSFESPAGGRPPFTQRAEGADEVGPYEEDSLAQVPEVVQRFADAADVVVDTSPDSAAHKVALGDLERAFRSLGPLDEASRRLVAQAWERVAEHRGKVDNGVGSASTVVGE